MHGTGHRIYVYHPTEAPVIIFKTASESMIADGWFDNPAKCPGFIDRIGVDEKDSISIQVVGKTTAEIVDFLNGSLNVSLMTKAQLEGFAATHFKVRLVKRELIVKLREEVSEMIKEKQEGSN